MSKKTTLRVYGIISYPNLLKPRKAASDNEIPPKYSVAVLIPKSDKETLKRINAMVEVARENGVERYGKKNFKDVPFHDGAEKYPDKPEYHDYMILNASSPETSPPYVVNQQGRAITLDSDEAQNVYAGLLAWVVVNPYAYNIPTKSGIAFGLNGVMVTNQLGALDRLDGRVSFNEMFGDIIQAEDGDQDENLEMEFSGGL